MALPPPAAEVHACLVLRLASQVHRAPGN